MRIVALLAILLCASCAHPMTQLSRAVKQTTVNVGTYAPSTRDSCGPQVAFLVARGEQLGVPIAFIPFENPGDLGKFYHEPRHIEIDEALNSCTRLETLAHELGHALSPHTLWADPLAPQVFADAVSYGVMRKIGGYDPRARYATYLAALKMRVGILSDYRVDIDNAVKALTQGYSK